MTEQQQKKLMHAVFMMMMTGGQLQNQIQMTKTLKGLHFILGQQEGLSPQECDDCLLYFFKEYAMGCSAPLSDSYIKTNMITTVKNFASMDIARAASLLITAKSNL